MNCDADTLDLTFGALRAIKPDLPQPQRSVTTLENPERFMQEMQEAGFRNIEIRSVTKAFPTGSTGEFWDNMVKGSAPIQMMKTGIGRRIVAREGKACAGLAGRDTAYAEETADFGCVVGDGGEMITAKKLQLVSDCLHDCLCGSVS